MFSGYHTTAQRMALIMLLALLFMQTGERTGHAQKIQPPDVYQLASQLAQEVEKLRWHMGRPINDQEPPVVRGVSPYEVFFQAKLLARKSSRLAFELTFDDYTIPASPIGAIAPRHVYELVKMTSLNLRLTAEKLNLDIIAPMPPLDPTKTPTDVFKLVVQISRQLNLLINRSISPSDVHQTVTVAISYADTILSALPNPPPPPQPLTVEPGKRPQDVFAKLEGIYEKLAKASAKTGLEMMTLTKWTNRRDIQPSDVLDLASTIVAGLTHIHKNINGAKEPRDIRWQHGMFPSDVYNRALVLETQIDEIIDRL